MIHLYDGAPEYKLNKWVCGWMVFFLDLEVDRVGMATMQTSVSTARQACPRAHRFSVFSGEISDLALC